MNAREEEIRAKMCMDLPCTFDSGCGCLDALRLALESARSEERKRTIEEIAQQFDDMAKINGSVRVHPSDVATAIRSLPISE